MLCMFMTHTKHKWAGCGVKFNVILIRQSSLIQNRSSSSIHILCVPQISSLFFFFVLFIHFFFLSQSQPASRYGDGDMRKTEMCMKRNQQSKKIIKIKCKENWNIHVDDILLFFLLSWMCTCVTLTLMERESSEKRFSCTNHYVLKCYIFFCTSVKNIII